MTIDHLQQAQDFIIAQFKLARPKLLEAFGNIDETIKGDLTVVTQLDKQIEQDLRDACKKFDPSIGFVGEEYGQAGNADTFWLIDPIDGTESFIRGIPFARNIVTLIEAGKPVMVVVYKFVTDEWFTAIAGQGAFKNGQAIHCSQRPLSRTWVELSSPFTDPTAVPVINAVRKLTNGYRMIGDFTLTAEGKVDALLLYKTAGGDWDCAPRALLMQEAGAKVANIGSTEYDYKNHDFLAANPAIFDELMAAIVEARR